MTVQTAVRISDRQLADYERDGVMFPVRVLSTAEAARFRAEFEALEACLGKRLNRIDHSHRFFPWAWELATHPALLDAMERVLGPDIFVHSTRILCKHAHDPSYVSWHQDGTYTALNSKPAPSAWIALTESTAENGCLRVIPGSHRHDKLPHVETHARDNLLNHGEEVQIEVDEEQAVDVELRPGEMSLHHVNAIHGSNANPSEKKRIGFAMSFITPAVATSTLPVIDVRNSRVDHRFEVLEKPAPRNLDEAIAAHQAFLRDKGMPASKTR